MNLTYNPFVDNGLYILGYYLNEEIDNITLKQVIDSKDEFSKRIFNLLVKEDSYLRQVAYHTHMNSSYTQIFAKKHSREKQYEMIYETFNTLLSNIGDDKVCSICGETHVNIELEISRAFMPNICANTFYNSSNNLVIVDICPICAYLSLLSILNTKFINKTPMLYLSDSQKFMKYSTEKMQASINGSTIFPIKLDKRDNQFIDDLCTIYSKQRNLKDGNYITQVFFRNGQHIDYQLFTLSSKQLEFIRLLNIKGFTNEMIRLNLINCFKKNSLIINSLLPYEKDEKILRCDYKFFKEVEGYELNERDIKIVKTTGKYLYENNEMDKCLSMLKGVKSRKELVDLFLEISEDQKVINDIKEIKYIEESYYKIVQYIKAYIYLLETDEQVFKEIDNYKADIDYSFNLTIEETNDIKIIKRIVKEAIKRYEVKKLLDMLNMVSKREKFIDFILQISKKGVLYKNLEEFIYLGKNYSKFIQYFKAELLLNKGGVEK
jgi:CRISPR-associated protein Cst1